VGIIRSVSNAMVDICCGDAWFAALVFAAGLACVVCIILLIAGDIEYRRHSK